MQMTGKDIPVQKGNGIASSCVISNNGLCKLMNLDKVKKSCIGLVVMVVLYPTCNCESN